PDSRRARDPLTGDHHVRLSPRSRDSLYGYGRRRRRGGPRPVREAEADCVEAVAQRELDVRGDASWRCEHEEADERAVLAPQGEREHRVVTRELVDRSDDDLGAGFGVAHEPADEPRLGRRAYASFVLDRAAEAVLGPRDEAGPRRVGAAFEH